MCQPVALHAQPTNCSSPLPNQLSVADKYVCVVCLPDAPQAADKCIELKPDFAKGYSRKGTLQYFMKEYDKAIETYNKGLELEPDSTELQEGLQRAVEAISRWGGAV